MDILEEIRHKFDEMARLPDERIELAPAALLISRIAYPNLDQSVYIGYLDKISERLGGYLHHAKTPGDMITSLNRVLITEEGFRPNTEDYFDPDNSFLNRVIDRKLGIPITLSLVQMEVGKRAALDIRGIGMPGQFITALIYNGRKYYTDPFHKGEMLSEKELQNRLAQVIGPERAGETHFFSPVTKKEILVRILRNLKHIYRARNQEMLYFQMVHWILTMMPEAPDELKERGYLYEMMGNASGALVDYRKLLEVNPRDPETDIIREKVSALTGREGKLH